MKNFVLILVLGILIFGNFASAIDLKWKRAGCEQICGNGCCLLTQICCGNGCCGPSQKCCGNGCCGPSQKCCGNGCCGPTEFCCGNACCTIMQT
ncbi:hypothetical protein RclHR1_05870001 [Rhizophagus clarus]|uniref:Fibrous sheath-interacting protein 2-like n=1 Tax=Rhizophagus clarus TaxID=94130 RepID=A0A2Z6SGM2_9GLOM|nr:hypothetical protein RclHR1_05870001 [Rhizophagus clarus]GES84915.1 fibrous sheath-interacting protein 2-like [Rhizophagus clarus]